MKTIKIIDLLKNYADGKEMPKKIKYKNNTWEYHKNLEDYIKADKPNTLFTMYYINRILNDELEILDEEDEFEDISEFNYQPLCLNDDLQQQIEVLSSNVVKSYAIIKQLIKNQKKVIEKLKEK